MQEYFNEKAEYLLSARFVKSIAPEGIGQGYCRYRLDGTAACPTRCVVGRDIPDEKYDPKFDNNFFPIDEIAALVPEITCIDWDKRCDGNSIPFLRRMQKVHDNNDQTDFTGRRIYLQHIADDYNLDATVLKV